MDTLTGTAGNTISSAILVPITQQVMQQIDDIIHLDDNRELLEEQLYRMKSLLLDISSQFRDQQREAPDSLKNCLLRMQSKVGEARELIHRSQRPWLQQCIDCLFCKPKVFKQIREWNSTIRELHDQFRNDFSVFCSAQQIVSSAPQQAEALLQDEPDTGLVGLEIKSAETQLQSWVSEGPNVGVIGVYGMGGVGKTTLVKKVYNTYKVSNVFDHVIWVTVAQFSILQIQNDIASAINLDLSNCSADMKKMKLCAHLKTKKFFLVLDDMWRVLSLNELGVQFGKNKGSKVVFTTRNRDLIREMNAKQFMEIKPLQTEEACEFFLKVAFEEGHIVREEIENIGRQVAEECKGLPLAIKVIGSTMMGNTAVDEWKLALKQMKKVDLNFPITHPRIDRELYQRLRWSYDALRSADLKNCFLYCAMFEEDARIPVDDLVRMWISEGLVKAIDGDYNYLLDTGCRYVKLLHDRCLVNEEVDEIDEVILRYIYVHDVLRDMGIYIGEKEENYAFRAGHRLQRFPDMEACAHSKRLSLRNNNITSFPTNEFRCPNLVSLLLGENIYLREIPEDFFLNFANLKVLDLSLLPLKSLPTSLWQLIQLEFLDLRNTQIQSIPGDIGNLVHLQFLCICNCASLLSLPDEIGKLTNLEHLDIRCCFRLAPLRHDIKVLLKCKVIETRSSGNRIVDSDELP